MATNNSTMEKAENISVLEHGKCTGCGACYNACPFDAIAMLEDDEGFLCPVVDDAKCTLCGLCEKKCPELHPAAFGSEEPECYAVWAKDEIRFKSSSGGVFTLLSEKILEQGGIVCGAAFSKDFRSVNHIIINNHDDLERLRKSKYVQSDTNSIFRQIKEYLDANQAPALFSGCPCQVAGLRNYLGKDYENLITVDLICHGVPSPKAFKEYCKDVDYSGDILDFDFRPKEKGWGHSVRARVRGVNGDYHEINEDKKGRWFSGYLGAYTTRKSCGTCKYAKIPRVGDITLGDFWGIENEIPEYNDEKGTSCVLANTRKGREAISFISNTAKLFVPVDLNLAIKGNYNLHSSSYDNPMRRSFFEHLGKHNYTTSLRYAKRELLDVGIITWWYVNNYGSCLTSYALWQTLTDMNLSALLIHPTERKGLPADQHFWKGEHVNVEFIRKRCRVSNYRSERDLYNLNNYCDMFMLGSDQLWNWWSDYTHSYMLSFADNSKIKIAYATSFGHNKAMFPPLVHKEAAYWANKLDFVSVREKDGVEIAKSAFGIEAEWVLDPVFLCDAKHYDIIADESQVKTEAGFILAYLMEPSEDIIVLLNHIEAKLDKKVIVFLDKQFKYQEKLSIMQGFTVIEHEKANVPEWVYHFKNCDYILTDSYHGLCFSLIFEKTFIALHNKMRGISRQANLTELLGLSKRLVSDPLLALEDSHLLAPLEYGGQNGIREKLEIEKKRSYEWLLHAVTSDKHKVYSDYDMLRHYLQNK